MQNQKADVLVLFGITGDLARKLVLPALYRLVERGELTVPVIGVALTDLDTDGLRRHVAECVRTGVRRRRRRRPQPHGRAHRARGGRLRRPVGVQPSRRGGRTRRVRGALPRRAAVALRHRRRRDRRRGAGAALPADRREAVRARPRLRPRAERAPVRALPGRPAVPGRPLPRQGARRGPARAAVRQHPARAGVEPGVDRPLRDHHGRGLRRRGPRLVLRRGRHGARRRPEPPAAGAHLRC